jgi:hypothetical protein
LVGTYALLVFAICLSSTLVFALTLGNWSGEPLLERWFHLFATDCLPWISVHPLHAGNAGPFFGVDLSLWSISVALPLALYLLIVGGSVLLYYSRPITEGPLILTLERLDEYPKPLLRLLGGALVGLASLLLALRQLVP